jgi:hypothetical protein
MSEMMIPAECMELSEQIRRFNDAISAAETDAERERIRALSQPYRERQMALLATAQPIPRRRRTLTLAETCGSGRLRDVIKRERNSIRVLLQTLRTP